MKQKKIKENAVAYSEAKPLSNVQKELLKLYSADLSPAELDELKFVLGRFYAKKATKQADEIWNENNFSDELIEEWLNEE